MENTVDKNKKECKDYFSSDEFKKKQLEELKIAKEINSDKSLTWLQKMDKILELVRSRGGNIGGLTISPSFNKDGRYSESEENEMIAHDFCLMFEASRDPSKCKITTECNL